MPKIPLDITDGFYVSDSLPLSAQRCVNWFPVVPQAKAESPKALFPTPGLKEFANTADGVNRGSWEMGEIGFFVSGNTLYEVRENGIILQRGTVEGSGQVSMADNGRYLVIVVPRGRSYAYDSEFTLFQQITDVDFIKSDSVTFKDGFFVFSSSAGDVFFNSLLNDPLSYDALDFGSAEISSDRIVSVFTNHNELFVIGLETVEVFQNVGGVGFPFQRIPGANMIKGSHALFSPIEFDNTFMFVGGGKNELSAVWRATGSSTVAKVSTSAIDNAIQKYTKQEIKDSFSWTYSLGGNFFAGFTFESDVIGSKTFVYDATASTLTGNSVWHERQTGKNDNRWRVNSILFVYGKLLVGDQFDGRIGEIDKDLFTEYGNVIVRKRISQPFTNNDTPMFNHEIQLTMEAGVGLTSGEGSDPQIRMSYSDEGGRPGTFSSEFNRPYGKKGKFNMLPTWRRQGDVNRHRVLQFETSEPVKSVIIKLTALASQGLQ